MNMADFVAMQLTVRGWLCQQAAADAALQSLCGCNSLRTDNAKHQKPKGPCSNTVHCCPLIHGQDGIKQLAQANGLGKREGKSEGARPEGDDAIGLLG